MSAEALIRVHRGWYPDDAIADATSRFTAFCSVRAVVSGEFTAISIRLAADAPPETVDEFLNCALLSAVERQRA